MTLETVWVAQAFRPALMTPNQGGALAPDVLREHESKNIRVHPRLSAASAPLLENISIKRCSRFAEGLWQAEEKISRNQ
jgi:hypothetical protein